MFPGSRASNSEVNDLTWPKFQLVRDFMPLLDTCKFEEVVIKTQEAMPRTMSNMFFIITQGQVTLRGVVQMTEISNLSEILCLSLLSGSLIKFQ